MIVKHAYVQGPSWLIRLMHRELKLPPHKIASKRPRSLLIFEADGISEEQLAAAQQLADAEWERRGDR